MCVFPSFILWLSDGEAAKDRNSAGENICLHMPGRIGEKKKEKSSRGVHGVSEVI